MNQEKEVVKQEKKLEEHLLDIEEEKEEYEESIQVHEEKIEEYKEEQQGMIMLGEIEEKLYYHHGDHLGSASVTTNESGDIVSDIRYYPYGATRSSFTEVSEDGESYDEKYKYNDKEEDETGLYYYGARYYDSRIGSWISNDPLQRDLGTMVKMNELNGYRYVMGNPMIYVDPTGLFNIKTGKIEKGDNLTKITKEINEHYETSLSMDNIAEANGIEDVNKINTGDYIKLPNKQNLELKFDNQNLQAYDSVYGIAYDDLKWEGTSGVPGTYDTISKGVWKADPADTEYFGHLPYSQSFYSQFGRGRWPGGTSSWGEVRTEMDNVTTGEKNTGYYIHGGSIPGSRGCIDLTKETMNFHTWFKYSWGKPIRIIVDYATK